MKLPPRKIWSEHEKSEYRRLTRHAGELCRKHKVPDEIRDLICNFAYSAIQNFHAANEENERRLAIAKRERDMIGGILHSISMNIDWIAPGKTMGELALEHLNRTMKNKETKK